ncbi:hypothetical protein BC826DRAFT_1009140 [Russula brevipes]|nr:hypothetical protein BC826DRAFT_1009140 [Russula brevipes]
MSPYVIPSPSPGADQNPPVAFPTATPQSPSAASFDTIDTLPSSLSSMIIGENFSAQSSGVAVESMDTPGPFTLHKRFFFEDGNITFLVDGILYRVHRYFFCQTALTLPTQEGATSPGPVISLENVKSKDFDALLSVLYPLNFNVPDEYSFEELSSILDLSTRWGFTSIRDLAIRCLKPPSPHQRLILGRKYSVKQWILPALQALCERPQPLTLDEARVMDFEDVVLVGSVREAVRSNTLTVKSTEIKDCIEAWKRGEPWTPPPLVFGLGGFASPSTPPLAQGSVFGRF